MKKKRVTYMGQLVVTTALLLVVLVFANLLAARRGLRARFDVTRDQRFTIAPEALDVVRNLPGVVQVTVVLTGDPPPRIHAAQRRLRETLTAYAEASQGKLSIEYFDPTREGAEEEAKVREDLQSRGIGPIAVPGREQDTYRVDKIYMSLEARYGPDKTEHIYRLYTFDAVNEAHLIPDFDYRFAVTLRKVTQERPYRVGFASNPDGFPVATAYRGVIDALKEQYDITENYEVSAERAIGDDLDALVVAAIGDFTPGQLAAIERYLAGGGRLIALIDRVDPSAKAFRDSNLNDLLARHGVRVEANMVLDSQSCATRRVGAGGRAVTAKYPDWIIAPNVNRDHPVVGELPGLALAWASSLDVATTAPRGARVTPLVFSSPASWVQTGRVDISLKPARPTAMDAYTSRVVAAAITGPLTNALDGPGRPTAVALGGEAQVIVVGDVDFLTDAVLALSRDFMIGGPFLGNALDWMTAGEGLIALRSRGRAIPRLRPGISDADRTKIQAFNYVALPVILIAIGLVVGAVRVAGRRRLARLHGENRATNPDTETQRRGE